MDKNEKRVVIKYLQLYMQEVLGDNAPSQATIFRQIAEFQQGSRSTENEHRPGCPTEMCTDDNVQHIQTFRTWQQEIGN